MLRVTALLILITGLTLAGCGSGVKYNHDFDQDVDFGKYRTYNWAARAASSNDASQSLLDNDLIYKRVQRAVDVQLEIKGLAKSETPDMLVAVHTGVQDKVNVQDWGYNYGYPYYGYGGRDIQVYNYQEGTLILDLIDFDAQELVWRGSATGTLDSNPTPQKVEEAVGRVVARMLDDYPPTNP